jgi:hypothetical protein
MYVITKIEDGKRFYWKDGKVTKQKDAMRFRHLQGARTWLKVGKLHGWTVAKLV